MDASTATLGGPEFGLTGGTMKHVVGSEANAYYIQYASASALAANSEVKFTINNVKNPYGYKSDGTTLDLTTLSLSASQRMQAPTPQERRSMVEP